MTLKAINTAIAAIKTATANQNTRIQTCAVMILEHLDARNDQDQPFNDANPAMRLVTAVAPRFRKPLIDWFTTYSRINVGKKGDAYVCSISKADDRQTTKLEDAKLTPWYETEAASDKDVLPLTIEDVEARVVSLAKFLQKKLDDGKVIEADRDRTVELIAAIKAVKAA